MYNTKTKRVCKHHIKVIFLYSILYDKALLDLHEMIKTNFIVKAEAPVQS